VGFRTIVADIDVPLPCQILSSIEDGRRIPVTDTLRVPTTAMLQILEYQRPSGPTVELSMLKITQGSWVRQEL
jgi:hypothetical protein